MNRRGNIAFTCECADSRTCWKASCLQVHDIPGTFVQGRGYTSLYKGGPRYVCMTREQNRCPGDHADLVDPENARCCYLPSYRLRLKAPAGWKTCDTCGAEAPAMAAKELNQLPVLPGVPCRHEQTQSHSKLLVGWYECYQWGDPAGCGGVWTHPPQPFEPPEKSQDEMLVELGRRLNRVKEIPPCS